jgi:pyruvate formate lyase activating enzyme
MIKNKSLKTKVWVRTPIIPGMTDSAGNISAIGEFLSGEMTGVIERWELLAFNKMCSTKYRKLGLKWILEEKELLPKRVAIDLLKQAKIASKDSCDVVLTGLTKN